MSTAREVAEQTNGKAISSPVPAAAVRWLVEHTDSNVELAILSNVCRQWRSVVSMCILGEDPPDTDGDDTNHTKNSKKDTSTSPVAPFQSLLLPSMVRQIQSQHQNETTSENESPSGKPFSTQSTPAATTADTTATTRSLITDTYCLSWFHPEGIEYLQLSADANQDDYDEEFVTMSAGDHRIEASDDAMESFIPGAENEVSYAVSNERERQQHGHSRRHNATRRSRSPTPLTAFSSGGVRRNQTGNNSINRPSEKTLQDKNLVSCLYQWNGYSQPMDVLRPFGYAPALVRRILDQAKAATSRTSTAELSSKVMPSAANVIEKKPSLGTFSSTSSLSAREYRGGLQVYPPFHTVAVRGATYARPEGYCLCWDQDMYNTYHFSERSGDSKAVVRHEELEAMRRKRSRRRRELQREVLPLVLWSKRQNGSVEASTKCNEPPEIEGTEHASASGILQPCIQFLNVDSSHAVRLFTPPFANGPVSTPLTIFVIAIATEDGCFFSGHRNKFEMGHLYPANAEESLTERSPISLCAEYQGPFTRIFETVTASDAQSSPKLQSELDSSRLHNTNQQSTSDLPEMEDRNCSSGYFNSDDSSCDISYFGAATGNPGWKCLCPLSGLGDLGSDVDGSSNDWADSDKDDAGHVCRGRLGPGAWHCYVAVFDGEDSVIKVDGVEEPVVSDTPIPPSFKACLDGLTIGSDHTFEMSLCFGQGSDGEGEGAMAELAVFKGRLDERDIEAVETHLMRKHGIDFPNRPEREIVLEDECMRMAHSLLAQPWDTDNKYDLPVHSRRVPLRYVAKLRQVAWKQINPVTGESVVVERIGSRAANANDSSDW